MSKRMLPCLLMAVTLLLSSCAVNGQERGGGTASKGAVQTVSPDPNRDRTEIISEAGALPDLVSLAEEKWEQNNDTVGWLRVPDTTIDDVVVWKPGDNDYYLRRNFEKRTYYNGVYYADQYATFGEGSAEGLGKNTVIYGHSMSDSRDDVRFGPIRYFLEEDFAREHPYVYFSTVRDNLAWEVVAVFYTKTDLPYNSNKLSDEEFAAMLESARAQSLFTYDYVYDPKDRFLTLSTCVYSLPDQGVLSYPNDYRLVLMARLAESDEKEEASLTRNTGVQSAYHRNE